MQQSIDTYNFAGKRAIIRVDFNVPLDASFNVTDDTRIRAAIPTIKKVLAGGGSAILMSHLDVRRDRKTSSRSNTSSRPSKNCSARKSTSPETAWVPKLPKNRPL